jgi:hypothetical protein
VANGILHFDLIEDRAIVQLDKECVSDGSLSGVMVFHAEPFVFHAIYLGTEGINAGIGSGSVCAV